MTDRGRSIFRADAMKWYLQAQEETVLPKNISPRTFLCLWILIGLLLLSLLLAWFATVPVYTSGPAIVADLGDTSQGIPNQIALVAFFPAEDHGRLRTGQTLLVHLDRVRECSKQKIVAVEEDIHSPDMALNRFARGSNAALAIRRPVSVALAHFDPPSTDPASTFIGSVYRADIEVGSQRVITLIPFIGKLFDA